MRYILYTILMVISLSGCSLLHYFSVKTPGKETPEVYNGFLIRAGADTVYSFQIKSAYPDSLSSNFNYCLDLYKYERKGKASPVQIRMYNKQGKLLMGWENCYGNLKHFGLFDSVPLRDVEFFPNNYQLSLQSDLRLFEVEGGRERQLLDYIDNHDFVIIVFYSRWSGWYSKDAIHKVVKYVQRNQNIALLLLNIAP